MKVHLDTDLGGDLDDLCALAMLLRWHEPLDITGITVVGDTGGRRTGYTRYALALEGREDIHVAAGAETAQGFYRYELGLPPEERYWTKRVAPSPNPVDDALALLKHSVDQGATILAIGPYTNLSLLEQRYPGILAQANLFLMGGWVYPVRAGFPDWGNEMDFNIQVDVPSARFVLEHSSPTLIPLTVTVETALRRAYLDDLSKAGGIATLIAHQAVAFAEDERNEERFGAVYPNVPPDIINFQHDPLTCAIGSGWIDGVVIEELPLCIEEKDGWLFERYDAAGRPFRVVTKIDGAKFNAFWLRVVTSTAPVG